MEYRPIRLGVNVDHVATVRQARGTIYPDPVAAAAISELAGADQITVHLREDRRHIQDRDVAILAQTVRTRLNLEMAATDEMVRIALETQPYTVTLVPEKREERTTEGGLDVRRFGTELAEVTRALQAGGIEVSLFIDPEESAVNASKEIGATVIELHTGDYCEATGADVASELERVRQSADRAKAIGLVVAAGHGLDYPNVGPIAAIEAIEELNIGHSLMARALFSGLETAVRDMATAMKTARLGG